MRPEARADALPLDSISISIIFIAVIRPSPVVEYFENIICPDSSPPRE